MRRRRQPVQLEISYRPRRGSGRGGKRPGAGRPRVFKSRVPHRQRVALASRYPVHVTIKIKRGLVRSLRTKDCYQIVRRSFVTSCKREGFRITDWSVMRDHIHIIVEAKTTDCLSRGMQSFKVRVAKGLNKHLGRRGTVFDGRYHLRVLKTPREVRNCLNYVLNNARRHGYRIAVSRPDSFTSWNTFDGWRLKLAIREIPDAHPPTAPPRTWLRRVGWRRHGLLAVNEVPGPKC